MIYFEYKEVKIPEEILKKIEDSANNNTVMTLGQAGVFDWLTLLSKTEGWRVVWQGFTFPYIVLEREKNLEQK